MLRLLGAVVGLGAALLVVGMVVVGIKMQRSIAGAPPACALEGTCQAATQTSSSSAAAPWTGSSAVPAAAPSTAASTTTTAPAPETSATSSTATSSAPTAGGPQTMPLTPAPLAILVPSCGEPADVLCRVPGTNAFAAPGTLYDPQTHQDAPIPAMPAGYRRWLCRVEHVNC